MPRQTAEMSLDPEALDVALRQVFGDLAKTSVVTISEDCVSEIPPALMDSAFSRKRRIDFASGRVAATQALTKCGISQYYPPVTASRAPLWPNGFAGSISHTDGVAAAVICSTKDCAGIGIDIERVQPFTASSAAHVLTARELLHYMDSDKQLDELSVLRAFSYKESIYKCISPLLDKFVDFLDVELAFQGDSVIATGADRASIEAPLLRRVSGRSIAMDSIVVSGCWIEPD